MLQGSNSEDYRSPNRVLFEDDIEAMDKFLVTHPNLHFEERLWGWRAFTPLQYAAKKNRHDVVDFFISKGVNVNFKHGPDSRTALYSASLRGRFDMVSKLLNKGADATICSTYRNETPIMIAALCGHIDVVKLLTTCSNLNQTDHKGYTVFAHGLFNTDDNRDELVDYLFSICCDIDFVTNKGDTYLDIAYRLDFTYAIELLENM